MFPKGFNTKPGLDPALVAELGRCSGAIEKSERMAKFFCDTAREAGRTVPSWLERYLSGVAMVRFARDWTENEIMQELNKETEEFLK